MCDFGPVNVVPLAGSGKGETRWYHLGRAQVYHDHFIAAQVEEGVVIDLIGNESEPRPRLCLELSYTSARELAQAILATLDEVESRRAASAP